MKIQTRPTVWTAHLALISSLLSAGALASASGPVMARLTIPTDSAETIAADMGDTPANHAPGLTLRQLETIRLDSKQKAAEAAFALGVAAIEREDFSTAQKLIHEAIQLHPTNPGYLQTAAALSFRNGRFFEAQTYLLQALEFIEDTPGKNDMDVAILKDNLGSVYLSQGHYKQAERTWQDSLAIREKALGHNHPSIAPLLNDLAGLAILGGRFGETEQLLVRALHTVQENSGSDSSLIAIASHNLADFYMEQRRADEAEVFYRAALDAWKGGTRQQRLQVSAKLNELGNQYLSAGRFPEAGSQFRLVIGLLEKDFGNENPHLQGARMGLEKLETLHGSSGEGDGLNQWMYEELRGQLSHPHDAM